MKLLNKCFYYNHSVVICNIELFAGFPYLCRPLFEYILNQNAESCLMFCKAEMVPHKETKDLIEEVGAVDEKLSYNAIMIKELFEYYKMKCFRYN